MSGVESASVLFSSSYSTRCASRNAAAADALIAKLMFCGMSPMSSATFSALSLDTTIPITLPLRSNNGPPLLPG